MLPPIPPPVSNRDFDPATAQDEDLDMEEEVEEGSTVELSSVEINILIYLVSRRSRLCTRSHGPQNAARYADLGKCT